MHEKLSNWFWFAFKMCVAWLCLVLMFGWLKLTLSINNIAIIQSDQIKNAISIRCKMPGYQWDFTWEPKTHSFLIIINQFVGWYCAYEGDDSENINGYRILKLKWLKYHTIEWILTKLVFHHRPPLFQLNQQKKLFHRKKRSTRESYSI